MGFISTAAFCKSKACPSAEMLLLYRGNTLASGTCRRVSAHLKKCDFCGAELQLLTKHPPVGASRYEVIRIPPPLYQLAMDILAIPARSHEGALTELYESGSLTLTDA